MAEEKIIPNDSSNENDGNKKSKKTYYKDNDVFIADCRLALTNSSDPEIEPLLTKKSYTKPIIASKLVELDAVEDLVSKQKKEYGDQYEATKNFVVAKEDFHEDYIDHLILARVAFKGDDAPQQTLELNKRRKQSKDGYFAQGARFYSRILKNADYKKAMNDKGVTDAEMQEQLDEIDTLIILDSKQGKEKAEAQAATKKRDAALHKFEDWFIDFKDVAIVALRKSPQMIEKLGWIEE